MRPGGTAALTLLAVMLAASSTSASSFTGPMAQHPKLGIKVESDESWSQVPTIYHPVQLRFTNRDKDRNVEITTTTSGINAPFAGSKQTSSRLQFPLPAGETYIEFPLLVTQDSPSVNTRIAVDGRFHDELSLYHYSTYMDYSYPILLTLGTTPAGLEDTLQALNQTMVRRQEIPLGSAARYWQCYLGLPGIVVIASRDVDLLTREQQQALARWVTLGGGTLWIHGSGHDEAVGELDLHPGSHVVEGEVFFYRCSTGALILSRDIDDLSEKLVSSIQKIKDESGSSSSTTGYYDPYAGAIMGTAETAAILDEMEKARGRAALFSPRVRAGIGLMGTPSGAMASGYATKMESSLDNLMNGLHEVPRLGYVLISFLLALLIGPVNFIVMRARRKQALFYVTAPALALTGMLLLLGYTVLDEGVSLKRKHWAVLVHEPAQGSGAIFEAHGTFAGLFPPRNLQYSHETAAIPIYESSLGYGVKEENMRHVTSWTPAQTLVSGWTRSRQERAFATLSPLRVRMGMQVTVDPSGQVWVENGLTATATWVQVRLVDEDGRETIYKSADVGPGDRVRMQARATSEDTGLRFMVPYVDLDNVDWQVVARMENLPHLTDALLGGEVEERRLWYVSIGHPDPAVIPENLKLAAEEAAQADTLPLEVDPEAKLEDPEAAAAVPPTGDPEMAPHDAGSDAP